MTTTPPTAAPRATSAQPTVRRLIVYTLLFALVVIAAIGLSGLLGRLLETRSQLAGYDVAGLARSLAFTLIGGPLAAIAWRLIWKRLSDQSERASLAWGLYIAAAYGVSLIVGISQLLATAAALIDGEWDSHAFATGVIWTGVWVWHRWMSRHPLGRPEKLTALPPVIGYVFGLVIGVGGAVTALQTLFGEALGVITSSYADGIAGSAVLGDPWWIPALQSLVWAAGGALVWWWHWVHDGARRLRSELAIVAHIITGILEASILSLGGVGTTLFVLLRLAFDRSGEVTEFLAPLDGAVAAAIIGTVVWIYYDRLVDDLGTAAREGVILVTSGVALVAAASGIGVIVNATLAALTPALVDSDMRTLLLGGISSLLVGGPLWWYIWRPFGVVEPRRATSPGRRIYLIAVFGLSAVVALVTVLVMGYRIFEFLLGDATGTSLVDRIRAPLGLLVATALVAGYHFAVWRHDLAEAGPVARQRTIEHIVLVAGSDAAGQSRVLREFSGAAVTVWSRADDSVRAGPTAEQLTSAIAGIAATRVVVIVGPGDRVEAIPLAQ